MPHRRCYWTSIAFSVCGHPFALYRIHSPYQCTQKMASKSLRFLNLWLLNSSQLAFGFPKQRPQRVPVSRI
jgi:hypothetical protein